MRLEIINNGLRANRIKLIIKKYPDMKIRISLEGFEARKNNICGDDGGFIKKLIGVITLKCARKYRFRRCNHQSE